jgi:hypothetical protein
MMDVCKVALTKLLRAAVESEGMCVCVCMYVCMLVCVGVWVCVNCQVCMLAHI